jgi:hypothetical protein
VLDAGRVALGLPATLERVLAKIEAGELQVHVSENGLGGTAQRVRRTATSRTSRSVGVPLLVCLAGLASGVILTLNALLVPGWFCLGLAALAALTLLLRR